MRSIMSRLAVAALAALAIAPIANAQSTTFASFAQSNPGAPGFGFNATTRLLTASNVPVRFTFGVNTNQVNAGQQIDALLNYSALLGPGGDGTNVSFTAPLLNVSFSFTAVTPINGQTDLLSQIGRASCRERVCSTV